MISLGVRPSINRCTCIGRASDALLMPDVYDTRGVVFDALPLVRP
jgi:hypothetical protein